MEAVIMKVPVVVTPALNLVIQKKGAYGKHIVVKIKKEQPKNRPILWLYGSR